MEQTNETIINFIEYSLAKGNLESTVEDYRSKLFVLGQFFDRENTELYRIDSQDFKRFVNAKRESLSPSSINSYIRVAKVYFNYLVTDGLIERNPLLGTRFLEEKRERDSILAPIECQQILDRAPKKGYVSLRNLGIVIVALDCMLKLSEIIRVQVDDINFDRRILVVPHNDGGCRHVPFTYKTSRFLYVFVEKYRREIPGSSLFSYLDGSAMHKERVGRVVSRLSTKTGVEFSLEMLRRTSACHYVSAGGRFEVLHQILGNDSKDSTRHMIGVD